MKKFISIILLSAAIACFSSCNESEHTTITEEDDITTTIDTDDLLYATTINSIGDTLTRRYNNTRQTLMILYKGDTIWLRQDTMASGIQYSNNEYIMTEWHGNTTLTKESGIVFQYPAVTEQ